MPSLLPGYEYDIFISYRHNDNRTGWVTEFVKNLRDELASSMKGNVSVYFDSSGHDALRVTDDVDESLRNKLRCAVFIPVISQTYCDENCFAWQNEFIPFLMMAAADDFGLKLKLANGNVSCRVLPVRIHDLELADQQQIESLIGAMRAVDFIYQSDGVSRPLLQNEIDPKANLNHTYYRDQVNKVVRGARDLLMAMQKSIPAAVASSAPARPKRLTRKKLSLAALMILVVAICGYAAMTWYGSGNAQPKSIAVLPFKLIGDDQEGKYFAEGVADALINQLHGIPNLRVRSRTSVEQYAGSKAAIAEIANDLDVEYILEGSAQKYKDKIRIIVQLINAATDEHIWFHEYNESFDDIFRVQSEIALSITSELNLRLGVASIEKVKKAPTTNTEAWDLFLRAREYNKNYWKYRELSDRQIAARFYKKAIGEDSTFAMAYIRLADVASEDLSTDSILLLINRAIAFDPDLPDAYEMMGLHFLYNRPDYDKAEHYMQKAIVLDSAQNFLLSLGRVQSAKEHYIDALKTYRMAFTKEKSEFYGWLLAETAWAYLCVGQVEIAEKFVNRALDYEPDNLAFLNEKSHVELLLQKYTAMKSTVEASIKIRKDNLGLKDLAKILLIEKKYEASEKAYREFFALPEHLTAQYRHEFVPYGYVLRKLGKEKEAVAAVLEGEAVIKGMDIPGYDMAKVELFKGNVDKSLDLLEKWTPAWGLHRWVEFDPLFEELRDHPRFQALVARFKADQSRQSGQVDILSQSGKIPTLDLLR
jgi:TolB-like protein